MPMITVRSALVGFCCCFPMVAWAQDCAVGSLQAVWDARVQERKAEPRFGSCAILPGDPKLGVVMLAFARPPAIEFVTSYDVELVLAQVRSGKIMARGTLTDVWESDAYKIDSAGIATSAFPLRRGVAVFGLTESWSGSSNVSFYSIQKLSLFAQRGRTLVPLLSELVTDIYQGEGCDVQTTRTLQVQPAPRSGYAPIRVSEEVLVSVREEQFERDCAPTDAAADPVELNYRNGSYQVPPHLKPFSGDR